MPRWIDRFDFLFRSTKGLILVAIALVSLETALWGTLSGPMAELGIREIVVQITGMQLLPAEREGRIVMLYHTIALAVVAIEVYLITAQIAMKERQRAAINTTITVGYIAAMFGGLAFGYFGHNWIFHGLFLFGQSLVFFAGVLLAHALFPWREEYRGRSPTYARGAGGLDLERLAFFTMAVAALGSSLFGAIPGSFFGNGFQVFLAEDVVRQAHRDPLQLAVIGHLHIMLTLIAVALALIVGRWFDFQGAWHKLAMPLMIVGTVIVTLGAWLVVPFERLAHTIIYVGSVFVLLAALCLVIFGFDKLIRERLAAQGIARANLAQKLAALLHDPLKFGALWQMVYMNFVVTFVGIFMAMRLPVIRAWPAREERVALTGHWHILAAIIATIILLYYGDLIGLQGRARQGFGWLILIPSDVAFAAATLFATKRFYVSESAQQPLVSVTMLAVDAGLAVVLVTLAILMGWRWFDLFKAKGLWRAERDAERTRQDT